MGTLISILTSFVLSGVIVNLLVQKWQYRNWMNQQRMLKVNLELEELKKLIVKITTLSDTRNYRARRICRSINKSNEQDLNNLREEHANAVGVWNESWNTFTVNLTMYADFRHFVKRLEYLQSKFVKVGGLLKYILDHRDGFHFINGKNELEETLNIISGETFAISRDLLKLVLEKQNIAYSDVQEDYKFETLEKMSFWNLIKYLFIAPKSN